MKQLIILLLIHSICIIGIGQEKYLDTPKDAKFIFSDIQNFWDAFDELNQRKNPFKKYLDGGSQGLKDFIKYRIESPRNLLKTVNSRRSEYEVIRDNSEKLKSIAPQIIEFYQNLEEIYPDAVYPPTFFVIGAFNSGGTAAKSGVIIGVEMQQNIQEIPLVVAHEVIHYNQNYPEQRFTLLAQSIIEGSAEFISELMTNTPKKGENFIYGRANFDALNKEFIRIMSDNKYHGWLYGTKGIKEGRPRDLGYWIGYEICKNYYAKSEDKNQAIKEMLNIQDFEAFLDQSEYLKDY